MAEVSDISSTRDRLEALRREIDGLDDSILALVEKRVAAAIGIAELKRSDSGARLRLRPAREAAVIERLIDQARLSPRPLVRQVWQEIMACCLDLQVHTELVLFAARRPADLADAMRRRFGCAAAMIVAESPAEALQAAREREAVAMIELAPGNDWWTALRDETAVSAFECLRDDIGTAIGLAVGRIAAEDLGSCPQIQVVDAGAMPKGAELLASAGELRLVLAASGAEG
jgi:chorismate mutase